MPEQKYYTDQRLNQGYVFTNLSKDIIEIVKDDMDYLSTNVVALRREGINNIVLDSNTVSDFLPTETAFGTDFKGILKTPLRRNGAFVRGSGRFTEDMLFGDSEPSDESVDVTSETYRNRQAAISQSEASTSTSRT